jgi:hypothetical protein
MDKRNQGQKTACARFEFMDMLLIAWKKSLLKAFADIFPSSDRIYGYALNSVSIYHTPRIFSNGSSGPQAFRSVSPAFGASGLDILAPNPEASRLSEARNSASFSRLESCLAAVSGWPQISGDRHLRPMFTNEA